MKIHDKRRIIQLLQEEGIEVILSELQKLPAVKVVNPLFAGLCNGSERVRWHAITAMGPTVDAIADQDMEQARIIMRRFMWSLNDESGGIGWGAPESMAEIMAGHSGLAEEYAHMLVSYMREDGNFLELEMLQRGLIWGIARLSQSRPNLMKKREAPQYLEPYLHSDDATVRGLAALGLGILKHSLALEKIKKLIDDPHQIRLYWDREFRTLSVGLLASQALATLSNTDLYSLNNG